MPDGGIEEVRHVKYVGHLHTWGEVLLELLDLGLDRRDNVVGIRTSNLGDHPCDSGATIREGITAVAEGAQFDLRYILQANDIARGIGLEYDVLVLGDALQTALVAERILIGAVS